MTRYRLWAELESPLVIRRQRQSTRSAGAEAVSGTLLRGALAKAYLQQRGVPDATFRGLFLDEDGCRFGPLDPAEHVFPRTAASCKREAGFAEEGKHGVVDLLVSRLRQALTGQPLRAFRCGTCGQDLKPLTGFWTERGGRPAQARRRWQHTLTLHVGIDRTTSTAAESVLFSLPALEPCLAQEDGEPPQLVGWVDADEERLAALKSLLAAEEQIVRVGHARTRGYGRLRLTVGPPLPEPRLDCEAFSRHLWQRVGWPQADPQRDLLFTLTLPTGAILLDPILRYTLDPSGMVPWLPALPSAAGGDGPLAQGRPWKDGALYALAAVAGHERLRGWHAAHGLPRQDEWLVGRGSVYVYLYRGGTEGRAALLESLHDLTRNGLGARRNEGYGQVLVNDEFALRFAEGAA